MSAALDAVVLGLVLGYCAARTLWDLHVDRRDRTRRALPPAVIDLNAARAARAQRALTGRP